MSVCLAGSVARGEDGPDSDIEFVVRFLPRTSLMDVAGLQVACADLLGRRVDAVPADADTRCRDALTADAVPL